MMSPPQPRESHRLAVLGAVCCIGGAALGSGAGVLIALLGLALLLAACVTPGDGFILIGPLARTDLARNARRGRPWLWRSLYTITAGIILFGNFLAEVPELFGETGVNYRRSMISRMAAVNETIGYWFAVCLFLYVSFVTLQVLAPAIAEDREAKRWDILLTTDLRPREILLGKLVGRIPVIFDPILSALPIIAILPLYGGIPAWFAGTVLLACVSVILGLAGLCFFYSLCSENGRVAAGRVSMVCFIYLILSGALLIVKSFPSVWDFPSNRGWGVSPVEVGDVIEWLAAGNPVFVFVRYRIDSSTDPEGAAFRLVSRFAAFHLAVFFWFGGRAMMRLRQAVVWSRKPAAVRGVTNVPVIIVTTRPANQHKSGTAPRARSKLITLGKSLSQRPPIGDWSVYWWERYGTLNPSQIKTSRTLTNWRWLLVIFATSLLVCLFLAALDWRERQDFGVRAGQGKSVFATAISTAIIVITSCSVLFPVVFRAARSVVRERNADTLESLLLTAYTPREILLQKLLAIAGFDLPAYLFTLAICLPAVMTLAFPALALLLYAGLLPLATLWLANVGLYFSVRTRSASKAIWACLGFLLATYIVVQLMVSTLFTNSTFGNVVRGVFMGLLAVAVGYGMWLLTVRRLSRERVN